VSAAGFELYTVAMSHIGADFANVYLVRPEFFVIGYSDETSPSLFSLKLSRVESPGRPPG